MNASVTFWEATAPVKLPTRRCPLNGLRPELEPQPAQRGIPTAAPDKFASAHHSLPRILYRTNQDSTSSYSKAPRGLSVLLRVTCIFTGNAISPGPCSRQCSSRYSIRAGRNLPDKEFRYLRTVIVTAAVYWDFNQELAPHHLIFQHRAGVTPYTSTFVFAECCVFNKQSQPPVHCNPLLLRTRSPTHYRGAPSPEVTELICRVPSPEFSQAP